MLLNRQQFNNALSAFVLLLLANPAIAGGGGNLSVSPDQGNETPQLQLENGGDNGMKAKTMEAETQQVMSQPNAGLNQVSSNSDFILEVPVEFNGTGTFSSEYGALEGQPYNQIAVYCQMHFHDEDWETPDTVKITETKVITLGPDSSFNGSVRFGIAYSGPVQEQLDGPGRLITVHVTGPSHCDLKLVAPDGSQVAVEEAGAIYDSSVNLVHTLNNDLL
ncbi:hypothetical protein J2T55_001380 [Methylohalomonas lacus]|uniref:Secreted protein n=1 Tax=Methylohalomonas lacus TaxID=398773 RepID=A0AAE3HLK1_9GAMM|nr:hypothetical protein [Methylohalomonas lacus]MCS3903359.1 hypothetical protein [Methylohalomonas lacus]